MGLYVTTEELKATKELIGTNFADADIDLAVEAASRAIDETCGRRFFADDVEQDTDDYGSRLYTPDSRRLLWIDDLIELASVTVDADGDGTFEETWTLGADFTLAPANAALDGKPYEFLRVRRTGGVWFPCGVEDSVRVKGRFGWSEVPGPIRQAAKIISARVVKRAREAPFGIQFAGGTDVVAAARIATSDPDVALLLKGYMRPRLF